MFAILSDIHGNRPALEAVFAETETLGVKRMLVLGDVIGYGPFPNDCLRMISGAEVCL
jgi:predicted phosphodiesterase